MTVVVASLIPVGIWTAFAAGVNLSPVFGTSVLDIAFAAVVLCILIFSLIHAARKKDWPNAALIWLMSYTTVSFVLFFSQFYWSHRTGFSHPLTRLDAVYVTMGTLTSGTGDLSATSESVRAIQMVQELLDLLFLLFAVGIVVSRIGVGDNPPSTAPSSPTDPEPSPTDGQTPAPSPEGAATSPAASP
jgi:hypothetical protein